MTDKLGRDIGVPTTQLDNKELRTIKELLEEKVIIPIIGKRCKSVDLNCPCCKVYRDFDISMLEIKDILDSAKPDRLDEFVNKYEHFENISHNKAIDQYQSNINELLK